MGYSNRTNYENGTEVDEFSEEYKAKVLRKSLKKRQCAGCGRNFTPAMKLDYCCNQCKIENQEMFSHD